MSIEAMKKAQRFLRNSRECDARNDALEAVEQAIAEAEKQEQCEPVAYDVRCDNCGGDGYDPKNNNYYCSVCEGSRFVEKMLYTTPQQRKPLTDEQIDELAEWHALDHMVYEPFARAIEAAHGIKENT